MPIGYADVENLRWADESGEAIDCVVKFSHLNGLAVPFTARADDNSAHGREIFQRAVDGDFGAIQEYEPK